MRLCKKLQAAQMTLAGDIFVRFLFLS